MDVHLVCFALSVALRSFHFAEPLDCFHALVFALLNDKLNVGSVLDVVANNNDKGARSLNIADRVNKHILPHLIHHSFSSHLINREVVDKHKVDDANQDEVHPGQHLPLVSERLQHV